MGVCNRTCRACIYAMQLANAGTSKATVCCDYIGRTGHMRPCPAGDGCTEFRPREGLAYNGFRQKNFRLPRSHHGYKDSVTGEYWWAFDPEEAYKLWEEGKNDKWIGTLLGCSGAAVGRWRKSRGLGINNGRRKIIRAEAQEVAGDGGDISSGDGNGQTD